MDQGHGDGKKRKDDTKKGEGKKLQTKKTEKMPKN